MEIPRSIDPRAVLAAVRTDRAISLDGTAETVAVECSQPTSVHQHIGHIHPAMGLQRRTALARAGRTRNLTTPVDDDLARVREKRDRLQEKLDELERTPDPSACRRDVAETQRNVTELRESVAAARGRLQSRREDGRETTASASRLEARIMELAEERTAKTAASEQLSVARRTQRQRRDLREQLLSLEDREANLKREARAHLVDHLSGEYTRTLEEISALPGSDPFETDPVDAAVAIAHIAELAAPLVISGAFDNQRLDQRSVDTPVISLVG